MKALAMALLAGSALTAVPAQAQHYQRTGEGVKVTPADGPASSVELTVHGDGIMHVVAMPKGEGSAPTPSLMIAQPPAAEAFDVAEADGQVRIKTARATAEISLANGQVRFLDPAGKPLLTEAAP
ncbi:MAG TPA: alpha-xylosidase, partial [Sphingomonas sp.]|nr:alpha-xylosidase [Sphingomonas sp.]